MLTLHAVPISLYCAKLRIVLRAKGLDWDERPPTGGYGSAQWLAQVPAGNLPTLVHGDLVISDSEAAAEYLDEAFPDPPLLPETPAHRALMRMRGRFHDTRLEPELRRLFPQIAPATRDAEIVAAQARALQARLDQLARMLADAPPLAFGLGDCGLVATMEWLDALGPRMGLGLDMPAPVRDWHARARAVPAVAAERAHYRPVLDGWLDRAGT
jgi:glutathione S-transferase/maleylpyruvate isomerase